MYPKEIMSDIYWGFYGGKYNSLEKFIRDVNEYNQDFDKEWNPDETVLACPDVTVQYSYWDHEGNSEIEENFDLVADHQSGFTAGEFLYKMHNQVVDKLENDDHHFFQGLMLLKKEHSNHHNNYYAPLYFIHQGS